MSSLYLLNETYTNGLNSAFLGFISLAAIICGVFVIVSKNPIVSVLFLIGLFLSMSAFLMMLGINFIGLSYLLVYVGAVSILFLFILMLINVRISELVTDNSNSIPLALVIGIFFNTTLYEILPLFGPVNNDNIYITNSPWLLHNVLDISNTTHFLRKIFMFSSVEDAGQISFVSSQAWDRNLTETSHITTIGSVLYTSYPIWLIITSMILLLAMVGAIVITIKQSKTGFVSSDNEV